MTKNNETKKFKLSRNQTIAAIVGGVAVIGSAVAVPAIAESNMAQHAKLAMSDDGDFRVYKAGWGGHRKGSHFADMSEAEIEKRVTKMVKHLSIEIDANEDQEKLIVAITTATAKDLQPLRAEFRAAGEELANLLTAETIDRQAIENLRAERLAATDVVSKKVVDAVAQISEVLTPKQREGLSMRLDQFRAMRDD
ncbi:MULTISPECIES: Spy/CpxP family protein refolding chaperone [unclassified Lentilitoribacter]|jgi:Spy/CpxP family protein refolding chaperone|uniref:Spy/CpxP family protein refolding chaperone n=1 Tax=unclassified Lentilitoribacter TaxID=2647570 RepID=UPI0013A6C54E|nr:periplasmic heavy metal sensor [Lentilitoribacter sp. Alg239-R112]